MVKITVRCKRCGKELAVHVHDDTAYLSFECVDCGAQIALTVEPGPPVEPPPHLSVFKGL